MLKFLPFQRTLNTFLSLTCLAPLVACSVPSGAHQPSDSGYAHQPYRNPYSQQENAQSIKHFQLLPSGSLAYVRHQSKEQLFLKRPNGQLIVVRLPLTRIDQIKSAPGQEQLVISGIGKNEGNYENWLIEADGSSRQILQDQEAATQLALLADGQSLIYFNGQQLNRYDLQSNTSTPLNQTAGYSSPLISPDGQKLAMTKSPDNVGALYPYMLVPYQTYLTTLSADAKILNLTPDPEQQAYPSAWMPDSKSIFVFSASNGSSRLLQVDLEGKAIRQLSGGNLFYLGAEPSPDGKHLLVSASDSMSDSLEPQQMSMTLLMNTDGSGIETLASYSRIDSTDSRRIGDMAWAADSKSFYYLRNYKIYRREISSSVETLVAE